MHQRVQSFHLAVAVALLAALTFAAVAPADPAGKTTLQETIRGQGSGFATLIKGPGEAYLVRSGGFGSPKATRTRTRRSVAFFAQLTDPQIADEMSPARVDFADPAGGAIRSSWRPQEAMGLQVFDQTVRNVNRNRTSRVRQGNGRFARLGYAITTGDLADNQQLNESEWFIRVLDGGRVDPFSGKPLSATNTCPGATPAEVAKLNADAAARRYTGVQDYADYATAPDARKQGFYDPNLAPPGGGPFAAFPRYPGLMDRAQKAFTAEGLKVPWFTSRGNHDGLIQGNVPASNGLFRSIAVGCLKVLPSATFNPDDYKGKDEGEFIATLADPATLRQLLGGAGKTPPDPDRRFISKAEYKGLHGNGIPSHGFGLVDAAQNKASANTASYYGVTRGAVRLIALDTVSEGGSQHGNIDDPQYKWLESELKKATARKQLVIAYGHHTLGTMTSANADEKATCADAGDPGCDRDPRRSTPIHRGLVGPKNIRDLLLAHPNVVALVAGHTHTNSIQAFKARSGRSGFWQVNTASHADDPQQAREIEIMDNRDGTLSLFATVLDQASPLKAPAAGANASTFTDVQLGSVSRLLAFNDPQKEPHRGARKDRNAELVLNDPRR